MKVYDLSQFEDSYHAMRGHLVGAPIVETGEWQAIREAPQSSMIELEDVTLLVQVPYTAEAAQNHVRPNMPWAEEHFGERVGGRPLNPPPSHERWPFAQASNDEHRGDQGLFSHTYPERFWPRFAGGQVRPGHRGIRFDYGDLRDLVHLLGDRPGTRQAYLPVWFPEDLEASRLGERVPCTLGYHFMIRNGTMKIVYYMRSCDFVRHFRDDVYLAMRLLQWTCEEVGHELEQRVRPGRLVMHVSSMHAFAAERNAIKISHDAEVRDRLMRGLL